MSAVYPTSLVTYTTKINHVDIYDASHVNRLQEEVIALQTYVGTNPHGSKADLTSRLAVLMATNGAIAQSNAFPATAVDGQMFYRTDLNGLYVYNGASWDLQGGSLSNVIFAQSLNAANTGTAIGFLLSSSVTPAFVSQKAMWACNTAQVFGTVLVNKYAKIAGQTTANAWVRIWTSGAASAQCRVALGSVDSTTTGTGGQTTPEWKNFSINLSSLVNGTVYDLVVELRTAGGADASYLDSILIYAV